VLTSGTKIERDEADGKPISVSVVTLMVDPGQAERLTLASTEGKIQLALRNPTDKGAPTTAGIRPASLMAGGYATVVRQGVRGKAMPAVVPHVEPPLTVEIIRGDKRAREVVSQE
jgi:pilus assembly protein CpaB